MPTPKKRSRVPRAGAKKAARKVLGSRASTDRGRGRAAKKRGTSAAERRGASSVARRAGARRLPAAGRNPRASSTAKRSTSARTPAKRSAPGRRAAPARSSSGTDRGPAKRAAPRPGRTPASPDLPPLPRPLELELRQTASRGREEEAKNNLRKALAAFDAGNLGSSLAAALKAKDAAPRSPSVREVLGLVLHARGDHKGALGELRAFRRMSGSPLQDPTISDCLRALGKPDEALEILGSLRQDDLDPSGWADAQIARAMAHADRGNTDAAIGVLRAVDDSWPPNPADHHLRVRYALADLIEKAGNREQARRLFARIAVHSPSFRDALDRAR